MNSNIGIGSVALSIDKARSVSAHPYRLFGTFRLMLAVLVLLSHSGGFIPEFVQKMAIGNVGVFCFFVLSGFVISEALDVFYRNNLKGFLVNRFLKIYPTFWTATLIGYLVLLYLGQVDFPPDLLATVVNLTIFLANTPATGELLLITIAWAVLMELIFYVLIAGVFAVGVRLNMTSVVLGGAGVLALALYVYVDATGSFTRYFGVFRFAPFFVLGVAYYAFLVGRSAGAAIITLTALPASIHSYLIYHESVAPEFRYAGLALFLFMLALFALLPFVAVNDAAEKVDKGCGDLTYAVYMSHQPVIWLVASYGLSLPVHSGIVVVASFLLAWSIFFVVERPVMKLRDLVRGLRLYS